MRPSVCVIVAAYNAADTIVRAVRSTLSQPELAELVVVDDASSDDTPMRAAEAAGGDRRFTLIRLSVNSGPSKARNVALSMSKAELVCVLDADDWLQDGRFARLLDGRLDWDLLADDLVLADEAKPATPLGPLIGFDRSWMVDGVSFVRSNISRPDRPRQEMGFLKPVMRRAFLQQHQLRYDETLRLGEDYVLYAEALIAGARLRVTPACGYVAVRRAGSLSHRHGAVELAALAQADRRLIAKARTQAPQMMSAIAAHRCRLLAERDFRRMLDAKAEARWLRALVHGLRSPGTALHIGRELWRAKRPSAGAA